MDSNASNSFDSLLSACTLMKSNFVTGNELTINKTKHLGSLHKDGQPLPLPCRPWLVDLSVLKPFDFVPAGDIAEFEACPDFGRWSLSDTPDQATHTLRWVEVEDAGRKILVCDRVILVRVSWDDLDAAGYVTGREITIDSERYVCRLLSGGTHFKQPENAFAGGAPDNEWDRIIGHAVSTDGTLRPLHRATGAPLDRAALDDPHNKLWNWFGAVSWTREPYALEKSARVCRGFHSAGFFYLNTRSHRHEDIGWRPVLERL